MCIRDSPVDVQARFAGAGLFGVLARTAAGLRHPLGCAERLGGQQVLEMDMQTIAGTDAQHQRAWPLVGVELNMTRRQIFRAVVCDDVASQGVDLSLIHI